MAHPPNRTEPPGDASVVERMRSHVEAFCGIRFEDRNLSRLISAFQEAAQECGVTVERLLTALSTGGIADRELRRPLVARFVTPETYFFRDRPQLEAVRTRVFPELVKQRKGGGLRLWSAGCATGEEAFTLLFLLESALGADLAFRSVIYGSDLNELGLQVGRKGCYGKRSFRGVAREEMEQWFEEKEDGGRVVKSPWKGRVHFRHHNLVRDPLPDPTMGITGLDLILCRNVLQYFSQATTRIVAERFFRCLAPGGWLIVGHAEYDLRTFDAFESHSCPGAILYRKPLSGEPAGGRQRRDPAASPNSPPVPRPASPAPAGGIPAAADLLSAGRHRAGPGRLAGATDSLSRLLRKDPLDVEARYLLALLHLHDGAREAAIGHLRRVLILDPEHLPALCTVVTFLRREGREAEARTYARRAKTVLSGRDDEEEIPEVEGVTVGDLRQILQEAQK